MPKQCVYPWYFNALNVPYIWNNKNNKGQTAEIKVADSCIDVLHQGLKHKVVYNNGTYCLNYLLSEYNTLKQQYSRKTLDGERYLTYTHGTAMAGLIASETLDLPVDPVRNLPLEYGQRFTVGGIAPAVSIIGIQGTNWSEVERIGFSKINNVTAYGKNYFDQSQRADNILISLSGGQKGNKSDGSTAGEWGRLIRDKCNDDFVLIVVAVGNENSELKYPGNLPACLRKPKSCKNDILLRVGSTNDFIYKTIDKGGNSNYGKTIVDILAPGDGIPMLAPNNYSNFGSGTSQAAAIVSSAVALLTACRPYASAMEIKHAILDTADIYPGLRQYVIEGRALNIYRAVDVFCPKSGVVLKEKHGIFDSNMCSIETEFSKMFGEVQCKNIDHVS